MNVTLNQRTYVSSSPFPSPECLSAAVVEKVWCLSEIVSWKILVPNCGLNCSKKSKENINKGIFQLKQTDIMARDIRLHKYTWRNLIKERIFLITHYVYYIGNRSCPKENVLSTQTCTVSQRLFGSIKESYKCIES